MPDFKHTPDLAKSLGGFDSGYLKIVAEQWGVELRPSDPHQAPEELATILLDPRLVGAIVEALPQPAREALQDLQANQGRLPWALFVRRYGEVREIGPGRRDREQPHRKPASPAEALWYRALIGRAFFDAETGPQEFAFIPGDLMPFLPVKLGEEPAVIGRAATPKERAHIYAASDRVLDNACILLAALRLALPLEEIPLLTALSPQHSEISNQKSAISDVYLRSLQGQQSEIGPYPLSPVSLKSLLSSAGLLGDDGLPLPEPTRAFLEANRGEALSRLVKAWLESKNFNELSLLPGLVLEGEWANDPLHARRSILEFLATVPRGNWWSLEAFVAGIRERQPDFQRPAGDYDSWFIRRKGTEARSLGSGSLGEYLRGYDHWNEVDGALIRFTIAGPLHWLGILDLAAPAEDQPVSAFRTSRRAEVLLNGEAPLDFTEEDEHVRVDSQGRLRMTARVPRAVRYQLARFCTWEGREEYTFPEPNYRYRLTPGSLERAGAQGLRIEHLLALLRRHAEALPPTLVKALERWEELGTQARVEQLVVLRLSSPEILKELRASRAARFLGDPLGSATVIVKPGAQERVLAALAELGYLGEATDG
jgi:hypothetical protein